MTRFTSSLKPINRANTEEMDHGELTIEKKEYVLLKRFLNLYGYHTGRTLEGPMKKLGLALENARIFDEMDMPKQVVRFNSVVTIGSGEDWRKRLQVVLPSHSDGNLDKISLLSPLGTALIGNAKGSVLKWGFPEWEKEIIIMDVVQRDAPIDISILL